MSGIPLLRLRNIEGTTVRLAGCNFLDEQKVSEKWEHFKLKKGDFLISTSASLGRVSVVDSESEGAIAYTGIIRFRSKSKNLHHEYLRAFLSSKLFTDQAEQMATGSVIRHFGPSHLKQMVITLPSIAEQVYISEIFDTLDDRITLLRETNKTLEAIAQAIFKSWFVDFDPVRAKMEGRQPEGMDEATAALFPDSFEESELGLVPKGWSTNSVANVIDTMGGATPDTKNTLLWEPPDFHWTTPKDLSSALSPVLLDTERLISAAGLQKISSGLLPVGTLLMSSRAPIGYLTLTRIPVAINQGYIAMPPGGILPPIFMYFWCKTHMDVIKGYANGSTFMEISKKAFRPIPITVPPKPIVENFAEIASCLFERISENTVQATTLCTVRDGLLPRLISGQLRLPEAQEQVENA